MNYITEYISPIGAVTLASDGQALTGLWINGQKYDRATLDELPIEKADLPIFDTAKSWLDRYFAGQKPALDELELRPSGNEFRQIVWKCLMEIPYGQLTTYKALAQKTAKALGRTSMSAQAVGGAVGHNPISIIIPCHRVVGTDGSLTGYAGGIDRKVHMLTLEGIDVTVLTNPRKKPV